MPTINTNDLTGPALDWAVAKAEGLPTFIAEDKNNAHCVIAKPGQPMFIKGGTTMDWLRHGHWSPSTNPAYSHPIIERERISTIDDDGEWWAGLKPSLQCMSGMAFDGVNTFGPTALIAAMRCHVLSRLGPTVDVPQELVS